MSVMRIKDANGNWQEVAALHGLPGTSVSITSISESTEDDGYSVVTFSDGKTLRVKNGSKGSPGEGGTGGGVLLVNCTPSEDMQSFTADKTVEEILQAAGRGEVVQAYVQGVDAVAQLFMLNESMVVFSAVASLMGDNASLSLVMMNDADGTNILTVTSLGGTVFVNITSEDGETYTADKTPEEMYTAARAGEPVYASVMGVYAPVQFIGEGEAVISITLPEGNITFIITDDGVSVQQVPSGGALRVVVEQTNPGECTSTMTASEIFAAVEAGQQVECLAFVGSYANVWLSPRIITPEFVLFGGVFGASSMGIKNQYCSVIVTNNTHTYSFSPLDKLPNPEPLTINGTSYDGSEAVSIDIAAGGGGGGSWVNLNALTSTTAPEINYTQEDNGTAYSLTAAMVEISVPAASETGFMQIQFWAPNGRATSVTYPTGINTITGKWRVYCFVDNGRLFAFGDPPAEKGSDNREGIRLPGYSYAFIIGESISKISIISKTSLPSGSMFEVWGVRA